jgi:hypothetical protein
MGIYHPIEAAKPWNSIWQGQRLSALKATGVAFRLYSISKLCENHGPAEHREDTAEEDYCGIDILIATAGKDRERHIVYLRGLK